MSEQRPKEVRNITMRTYEGRTGTKALSKSNLCFFFFKAIKKARITGAQNARIVLKDELRETRQEPDHEGLRRNVQRVFAFDLSKIGTTEVQITRSNVCYIKWTIEEREQR